MPASEIIATTARAVFIVGLAILGILTGFTLVDQ